MFVVSPLKGNATTYTEQFYDRTTVIPNIFIDRAEPSGKIHYEQMATITKASDGHVVYCLEVDSPILPGQNYAGQDNNQEIATKLTSEQWHRIELLIYYGYGYQDTNYNHSDLKWYAVTQYLIWQTVPRGWRIYFTDTLNGQEVAPFDAEISEMEKLLVDHEITPDFGKTSYNLTIGKSQNLTDKNGVLKNYEVLSNDYVTVTKNNNTLNIKANRFGNIELKLTKKDTNYSHPTIVYVKDNGQDLAEIGSYTPVESKINLNIAGGKVGLNKHDFDTTLAAPQGDAVMKGAVYGIYKEDDTFVTQIVTDANGYAISDYLDLGRYYLKELTPSQGYLLDPEKHYFEITTKLLTPIVQVSEKVIKREYVITKVVASNKSEVLTPEPNVEFGIYNKRDKLVQKLTTDDEGKITFTLPYGKYTLRQLTTPSGHEKIQDFEFEITEPGPTISKVFGNATLSARVKVIKVDQDGNNINISGIKFKIKDLNTNEYVCQTISYPNHQTYCEFATDENGILITPYALTVGDYQLEEVDQAIEGYLWNATPLKFSINDDSELQHTDDLGSIIKLKFTNEEVKGDIKLQKYGEKLVIKDGTYTYEQVPLANIVFGLYDSKGMLINKYTTDDTGHISIKNLKLGKYNLKELATIPGFVLDDNTYEINLAYQDQYTAKVTKELTLINYLAKGSMEFLKTDLDSDKPLKDVKIKVYTMDNELIYSGKTNENGKIVINDLVLGKYYLIEEEALQGYKENSDKIFFEIKENGQVVQLKMTNEKIKGTFEFTKLSEDGRPLANALIEIYNAQTNELIMAQKTDGTGSIRIANLEFGEYYLIEKEAPKGYLINTEKLYFEIKEDGAIVKKTMTDKKIKGTLEFSKVDTKENPMPNILIEVYNANTGKLIFAGRTNEDGKITLSDLEYGEYYIIEKETAKGYLLSEEKISFAIKDHNQAVNVKMINHKIKGTLEFTKKDFDNNLLANALIEIYNAENDELLFSGRTDKNGQIIIDNLEYGNYYILEKEAPEGYLINEKKVEFSITENKQIIKVVMKDEKIKMPNTYNTELGSFFVINATTLAGVSLILYAKRKKER